MTHLCWVLEMPNISSSDDGSTHWCYCYICRHLVRLPETYLICQRCRDGFVEKLSEGWANMVEHHHRRSNQPPQCQPQHLSGLDEAIQQLTLNNSQHGFQIPAPRSVIEALPTVRIGKRDAKSGLNCAVCLEDYKKHTRARQMPCNHMFHSDCIVPWLLQHNSCPVCRLQLPTESPGSVIKRAFFPFFWPFGGSSQHNYETGRCSST